MEMINPLQKLTDRKPGDSERRVWPARCALLATVAALALIPGTGAAQEGTLDLRRNGAEIGSIEAFSIGETSRKLARTLEMECLQIDLVSPSGEKHPGYVVTVYDPSSGLSWSRYGSAGPGDPEDRLGYLAKHFKFFLSDREIVSVQAVAPPPSLWLRRSTARAPSLASAREAALEHVARLAQRIQRHGINWVREVSLATVLPRDFFHAPEHARPRLELEVTSIAGRGNGWTVSLEGRQGRRAEVYLDGLFVLQAAKELPREPAS